MPPNVHKLSNVIFQAQSYRFLIKWCRKAIEAMLLISFCHLKQIFLSRTRLWRSTDWSIHLCFPSRQRCSRCSGHLWWYTGAESLKKKDFPDQKRRTAATDRTGIGLGCSCWETCGRDGIINGLGVMDDAGRKTHSSFKMSKSIQIRLIYPKVGVSGHESASFAPFAGLSLMKDESAVIDEEVCDSSGTLRRIWGRNLQTNTVRLQTLQQELTDQWSCVIYCGGLAGPSLWPRRITGQGRVWLVLCSYLARSPSSQSRSSSCHTMRLWTIWSQARSKSLFSLWPSGHHKWKWINACAVFGLVLLCPTRWWNASEAHGVQISGHPRGRRMWNYADVSQWACSW